MTFGENIYQQKYTSKFFTLLFERGPRLELIRLELEPKEHEYT